MIFLSGLKAVAPLLVGVIPFGMIYGVLALSAGIPPMAAQSISWIVFAGSAQLLMTQLAYQGASILLVLLTVGVVNLRHALYSASIAPFVKPLSIRWKVLLSYLLTDEAYALSIQYYQRNEDGRPDLRHWFFLGAGITLWLAWQISTAIGIFLGSVIPESWSLDFTLALTFIAIVVPGLTRTSEVVAAITAGIIATLCYSLPNKLGLIAAALIGIWVGIYMERKKSIK